MHYSWNRWTPKGWIISGSQIAIKDFSKLQIAFTSNLGTNAGVMVQQNGLGYPVSIEGAAKYWRDILVQRRISPEITTSTVIAWRRNIP